LRAVASFGDNKTLAPKDVCSQVEHLGIVFDEEKA